MKRLAFIVVVGFVSCAYSEVLVADPSILFSEGRYLLVGTENGIVPKPGERTSGQAVFPLYVSEDLQCWKLAETPLGAGRLLARVDAFGTSSFWAPQLFRHRGHWFFAYSCDRRWGLAAADRAEGPFKTVLEFPRDRGFAIDPYVFRDDDGGVFAYYSGGNCIRAVRLTESLDAFDGDIVTCVVSDREWERLPLEDRYRKLNQRLGYGACDGFNSSDRVIEGPSVLKRHGKYVLFYSANDFRSPDYCVGVAVADAPKGPWKKLQGGPVLWREQSGLNGTGHGDVFFDRAGELWYVFHAHNSNIRIDPRRTGIIRLHETVGTDGYPRYAADPATMHLL